MTDDEIRALRERAHALGNEVMVLRGALRLAREEADRLVAENARLWATTLELLTQRTT